MSQIGGVRKPLKASRISFKVVEVAEVTGFSENFVRLLITRQELPVVRCGRSVRVLAADLERFLEAKRVPARGEEGQ